MSTSRDLEAYRRMEDELRTMKQQFEALINNSTVAFLVIDLTGHIVRVNDTFEHTFGWTQEEVLGHYLPFIPEQHRLLFEESLLKQSFFGIASEELCLRKDGTQFIASETVTPIRNEHGDVTSFACILRDITERKASELRLNVSEQRYKSLFENNPNAIYSVDQTGRFTELNPAVEAISGYKPEELLNRDHSELLLPEYVKISYANLQAAKSGERQEMEASFIHKNGHRVDLSVISLPIQVDGEMVGMYCIAQDITERKHAERMINRMAFTDCLTDLPNRRLFKQRLSESIKEAHAQDEQLAVLFIDLDRFKIINDSLGHAFGDHVLQAMAERLKSCITPQDTLSRMGGDEFTLLLPKLNGIEHAITVSQRLLQIVREPLVVEGTEVHITTSIGIALYPDNGLDTDTLMKNADIAMYRIKERGKNNYQFFSDVMNEDAVQNLQLERELRKALERDEFILHYQPQVNVVTGQITGMEALIRWQHPVRGLLSPIHFIPLAEETGLIVPIGEWVLRKACQDGCRWSKLGRLPMRIAVNLSLIQFQEETLVQNIQSILDETGLEPRFLELEITESIAMHNVEQVVAKLEQLVKLGVQISIDDFGTGFSSLSYLKKFPIHKLKIDRSFITDITSDPDDASIVSAIIAMANSLKLNLIVEGVETEDQQFYLHRLGCFEMQGYLFSRPLPVSLLDQLLEQWV
ncbi:putative bifunctional diguanylate cyclase/phosphodiesterase [Tumebacillus permanentifrigoris]|uniref:putative bifunctional diguanylate cyclase/phosphodiesterase n=1 Tax=Tumebacillus permanentifrigoris TaxID=378543 RepID=UPI0011B21825|nr:bifunctional diguanylate cyclase/phosphodiesterase [Tumebacillus permanentifrigoris]